MSAILSSPGKWAKLALVFSAAFALSSIWIHFKRYAFDEAELIRLTQKHIGSQTFGQNHRTAFGAFAKELRHRHPNVGVLEVVDDQFPWVWTKFGGLVGASTILYSSLTEFVAFYGTSVDTSGLSARCFLNVTATIVQGSVKVWSEGETGGKRLIPGESVRLFPGHSSAISIDSSSWMVVYGRGFPATCLPPIILQHILSFDFWSTIKLMQQIGFSLIRSCV